MDNEFAKEAGLLERDMPSPHHPLMQNDEEIRTLSDLIDARGDRIRPEYDNELIENDLDNLDVSEALTFPHTPRRATSAQRTEPISDLDADARTTSPPDDEEDAEYMTRADFVDSMGETDPDPNTGMTSGDFIEGAGLDRAPDITGTVGGITRGMATHLPQDLGADGFQIEEPEALRDPRALKTLRDGYDAGDAAEQEARANAAGLDDEFDPDAGRIPVAATDIDNRDEALDATRQLK